MNARARGWHWTTGPDDVFSVVGAKQKSANNKKYRRRAACKPPNIRVHRHSRAMCFLLPSLVLFRNIFFFFLILRRSTIWETKCCTQPEPASCCSDSYFLHFTRVSPAVARCIHKAIRVENGSVTAKNFPIQSFNGGVCIKCVTLSATAVLPFRLNYMLYTT